MADVKSQIAVKPRNNQNIPPVLQRFLQKQSEASGDSQDPDSATEAVSSGTQHQTKSATLDKGQKFTEATNQSFDGVKPGVAKSPNIYKPGQVSVPAVSTFTNNFTKATKGLDSTDTKPTITQQSPATKSYIKKINQSSDQNQFTKQPSNSNVVDTVHENSSQVNETKSKTLNQFSPRNSNPVVSPTTTSSSSSAQQTPPSYSGDDGVVIDFRSALRPTRNSVLSELFDKPTSDSTAAGATAVLSKSPKASSSLSPAGLQNTHTSWKNTSTILSTQTTASRVQSSTNSNLPKQDNKGGSVIVERNSDHKRFKRSSLGILATNLPAPRKTELPNNVDLTEITQKYGTVVGSIHMTPKTSTKDAEDDDDIYIDAISVVDGVRGRPAVNKQQQRASLIEEISAEEEGVPLYDDAQTLVTVRAAGYEELYADGESEKQAEGGTVDDVYEDAVTLVETQEYKIKKQQQKEKAEAKKKEEKERKEKEKEEKRKLKDEKMKIKKEKELAQQQKQFNLTGNEASVGEGVMKQDFKDLSLKQGQKVTIIRLDKNPPNMWLIKTDTSLGYVSSNCIEVDPAVIRQAMYNIKTCAGESENDQIYDSVDME